MKPILVLYATREGQTRTLAEHVTQYIVARGLEARLEDVENPIEGIDPNHFQAVVLVASVHHGNHAREMIGFARAYRNELARLPIALLSVSLTAASAEDDRHLTARHAHGHAEIAKATRTFLDRTGLRPARILAVAGALLYSEYGRFVRFIMQRIPQDGEPAADTTRGFEYAAWARLDRFVDEFLGFRPSLRPLASASVHA
jgi:menaquinone-dependent protoporphyrinogen oxidase